MAVIDREKEFWDKHEEFDWMAESSKRDVVAMLPPSTATSWSSVSVPGC